MTKSIATGDLCELTNNESLGDIFAEKIIPGVRSLDLSNRPWENSYNGPAGPDDPVEDHPYLFFFNRSSSATDTRDDARPPAQYHHSYRSCHDRQ